MPGNSHNNKTNNNMAHQKAVVLESNKRAHKCPSLGPWCLGKYYCLFLLGNKKFKKEENDKIQPNHIEYDGYSFTYFLCPDPSIYTQILHAYMSF